MWMKVPCPCFTYPSLCWANKRISSIFWQSQIVNVKCHANNTKDTCSKTLVRLCSKQFWSFNKLLINEWKQLIIYKVKMPFKLSKGLKFSSDWNHEERIGIRNSLSTNQAKSFDFPISLLDKLKKISSFSTTIVRITSFLMSTEFKNLILWQCYIKSSAKC